MSDPNEQLKDVAMAEDSAAAHGSTLLPRVSHAWRALRYRNFRLFFAGQSISLMGTWMTRIATVWLVYRLTGSAILLGTVAFVGQIPIFLLAPFAGVWLDRLNRQHVLLATQALAMLQSVVLAALTLTHRVTVHELLWLSALQGVINALDIPVHQAFLVQLVEDKKDLGNAIAINSSMVTMARLVGPALAGLVIAATNEGWCFLIDGASYLAVLASLLMMRVHAAAAKHAGTTMLEQLREGWTYVSQSVPLRTILLLFAVVNLMGTPFTELMPMFASKVLHGGPHALGLLMGASGMGALAAALSLAARRSVRGLTKVVPISAALFGAGLILFGLSRSLWISLATMVLTGFGTMLGMAASNTIIQTIVSEDKRGRVMSYYAMAFVGMMPFGSLLAGAMANAIGAPLTVIVNGSVVIAAALWFT
ncbi:MAG: MFS transporter, partial [Candidatus Korobacteraceae bacterium]